MIRAAEEAGRETGTGFRAAVLGISVGLLGVPATGWCQQLFKCGNTYQDRPCIEVEVQKRYAAGRFDVDQVNPDTDKDCAKSAAGTMPYWMRMHHGESAESILSEQDGKPTGREERSRLREVLNALSRVEGTPKQARSQLEHQCMAQKQKRGVPTERDLENAREAAAARVYVPPQRDEYRDWHEQRRLEATFIRERAAADRAAQAAARRPAGASQ